MAIDNDEEHETGQGDAGSAAGDHPRAGSSSESLPRLEPQAARAVASLRGLLLADIKRFDGESCKHRRVYRRAELLVIVATAATTVAAGLGLIHEGQERAYQFAVLVLSTFGAAITSWAASRRARDLWQHEREVFYALKDILRELEFRSSSTVLAVSDVEGLFRRSATVLASSTVKWVGILRSPPSRQDPSASQTGSSV